jgi:hypothetical protein
LAAIENMRKILNGRVKPEVIDPSKPKATTCRGLQKLNKDMTEGDYELVGFSFSFSLFFKNQKHYFTTI